MSGGRSDYCPARRVGLNGRTYERDGNDKVRRDRSLCESILLASVIVNVPLAGRSMDARAGIEVLGGIVGVKLKWASLRCGYFLRRNKGKDSHIPSDCHRLSAAISVALSPCPPVDALVVLRPPWPPWPPYPISRRPTRPCWCLGLHHRPLHTRNQLAETFRGFEILSIRTTRRRMFHQDEIRVSVLSSALSCI